MNQNLLYKLNINNLKKNEIQKKNLIFNIYYILKNIFQETSPFQYTTRMENAFPKFPIVCKKFENVMNSIDIIKRNTKFTSSNITSQLFLRQYCKRKSTLSVEFYKIQANQTLLDLEESLGYISDIDKNFDCELSEGVLTIILGKHGTWVINKQVPNLQLWWSSPISGPKRFSWDEITKDWIEIRKGQEKLSELLKKELNEIFSLYKKNK